MSGNAPSIIFGGLTVSAGSTNVNITTSEDATAVKLYSLLVINNYPPVVVKSGSTNNIELVSPWPYSNVNTPTAGFTIQTGGDFTAAVNALTAAQEDLQISREKEEEIYTSTAQTITITDSKGNEHTFTTYPWRENTLNQLESDLQTLLDSATIHTAEQVQILVRDTERMALEQASGGKNTIMYDAQGNANTMVWIPSFNCEDINAEILSKRGINMQLGTGVHPAFITNGVTRAGFWYAKYMASNGVGGGTQCVAGQIPKYYVDLDSARNLCTQKGAGWHLGNNWEWSAIALLSMAHGAPVRGNTDYGRAHDAKFETAKRGDSLAAADTGGNPRTETGTGPVTWSHDGTVHGVYDLVGNLWEWIDGLKLQDGNIIMPTDNQPFLAEPNWTATDAYFDSTTASGGEPVLSDSITNYLGTIGDDSNTGNSANVTWQSVTKSGTYTASELLRRALIEPAASSNNASGRLYMRNFGERFPLRGGNWYGGSSAGLAALNLNSPRGSSYNNLGFRPAFLES